LVGRSRDKRRHRRHSRIPETVRYSRDPDRPPPLPFRPSNDALATPDGGRGNDAYISSEYITPDPPDGEYLTVANNNEDYQNMTGDYQQLETPNAYLSIYEDEDMANSQSMDPTYRNDYLHPTYPKADQTYLTPSTINK